MTTRDEVIEATRCVDQLRDATKMISNNAELILRLRKHTCYTAFPKPVSEAADALEAADKRIAELEADLHSTHARVMQNGKAAQEAERKLAVARESMCSTYKMLLQEPRAVVALEVAEIRLRKALAQIGGDDAG